MEYKHRWKEIKRRMKVELKKYSSEVDDRIYSKSYRWENQVQCSACDIVTSKDISIYYKFCPHCGEELESEFGGAEQ